VTLGVQTRSRDGKIACNTITYVDDLHTRGNTREEARQTSRRVASRLNWLGLQDAARKRRDPSLTPGPWAGSIIHSDEGVITVSVGQDCWDKAKEMIKEIKGSIECSDALEHSKLESCCGYLIYLP